MGLGDDIMATAYARATIEALAKEGQTDVKCVFGNNDPAHADSLARHGLPIAVVVGDKPIKKTAGGLPVAMCPAQDKKKGITCAVCKLCANPNRRAVVGFLKD